MKRNRNPFTKSALLFVCLAAGISLVAPSCKKDDDAEPKAGVTEAQAVTVVSDAMINSNSGLVTQVNLAAMIASGMSTERKGARLSELCGLSMADSTSGSANTNTTSFSYKMSWNYELNCVQEVPQYLALAFTSKVNLSNEKMTAADNSAASFKVSGLADTDSIFIFNQKYDRTGEIVSKTDEMPSFSSVIAYTATDVKVSKATHRIISGTAALTISGRDSKGNSYKYAGTITFKGNQKATLLVGGGSSYELTW